MELGPHRDTLIANLSGGQIKRVSLGAELLAKPCLLYIDEATSGLDAGTESRMMRLFRRLADDGRSILCITHNVDNVDQCHLALVLARGKLIYYGPPGEAPTYFGVCRISEIYDRTYVRNPWRSGRRTIGAVDLHEEFVAGGWPTPTPRRRRAAAPRPGGRRLAESGGAARPAPGKPLADRFRRLTEQYLHFRQMLTPILDQWRQFRVLDGPLRRAALGRPPQPGPAAVAGAHRGRGHPLIGFWGMPFRGVVSPFDAYVGRRRRPDRRTREKCSASGK